MAPTLYFAYGSNLWLEQMARRCPSSYFVGRAILPDYRWQINERGFANVVPSPGHNVHGLVYELGSTSSVSPGDIGTDERRLDRNEGVHTGAYAKAYLPVMLYEAWQDLQTRTTALANSSTLSALRRGRHTLGDSPLLNERTPYVKKVLVYLSETYTREGDPREEYIDRINSGIVDAVAFGVPAAFVRTAIRPYVPPDRSSSPGGGGPSSLSSRGRTSTARGAAVGSGVLSRTRARSVSGDSGPTPWDGWGARPESWTPEEEAVRSGRGRRMSSGGGLVTEYWTPVSGFLLGRSRSTRRG